MVQFVKLHSKLRIVVLYRTGNIYPQYKGRNYTFDPENPEKDTIHLGYIPELGHYVWAPHPKAYLKQIKKTNNILYCGDCCESFIPDIGHCCDTINIEPKKRINTTKECCVCSKRNIGKCDCGESRCRICQTIISQSYDHEHRCINYFNPYDNPKIANNGEKGTAIWVYDFEAEIDREGFEEPIQDPNIIRNSFEVKGTQKANFVHVENLHSNEEYSFQGNDCLQDFMEFCLNANNGGKNIFFAHNGKGYDTRLIFDDLLKRGLKADVTMIMRGSKFMQLKVGKCIFRDSMLHVSGSLKSLGKEICEGVIEKGFFPHLFNTKNNWNYIGEIPDKLYFEPDFMCKNDQDLKEFETWHNSWNDRNDWNFQTELKKYCINDVKVLKHVLKGYEDGFLNIFKDSPLFSVTAPAYVHTQIGKTICNDLELGDPNDDIKEFTKKVVNLDIKDQWVVLKPDEYYFARRALRGGRTDVRRLLLELDDEAIARGENIRYVDVCSMYPYMMIQHDYPTGPPTIYYWDSLSKPCKFHKSIDRNCNCRNPSFDQGISVHYKDVQPTIEELLSEDFFGIVSARVKPPNDIIHPVLITFDQTRNKCIAPAYEFEGTFTSIEFQEAIKVGYEIIQVYRFDKYKKSPSKWKEIMKKLYMLKIVASEDMPSQSRLEDLKREYELKFEMGDMIQQAFDQQLFKYNPALKQVAKIFINSAWGKQCQRPHMTETVLFDETEQQNIFQFYDNLSNQNFDIKNVQVFGEKTMFQYMKNISNVKLDVHDSYIVAGLFVPAYGRLHLWKELYKLGTRVLMNDTDSIVYHQIPGMYDVPTNIALGDWEIEKIDYKNGGIKGYVGVAPKTYAMKCVNGKTSVKTKGVCLSLKTDPLINYETMKKAVQDYLTTGTSSKILVPQKAFSYTYEKGIQVNNITKEFQLKPNDFKGKIIDGYLYPFGYLE
jgi:hypothetical protein